MTKHLRTLLAPLLCAVGLAHAGSLNTDALAYTLNDVAQHSDGRFGACVSDGRTMACTHGDQRFPLFGLMHLPLAITVMDLVDRHIWRLDDQVYVTRSDLGFTVQPIADKIGPDGYKTSIGDLLEGMLVHNDAAAANYLLRRLGGQRVVQHLMEHSLVKEVHLDRDEWHLRADILGMDWQPTDANEAIFAHDLAAIPDDKRQKAFDDFLKDTRDTATPRGMVAIVALLADGKRLSPDSTTDLLKLMAAAQYGQAGLKAGLAPGWQLAGVAARGPDRHGVNSATDEIGLLTAPDGTNLAVCVFSSGSKAPDSVRAAAFALVARAATAAYEPSPRSVSEQAKPGGLPLQ
ncbi:MAG: serine hydrolase [Burkholderiales bacterium]|nr:serine hydrolase [Burkholderiales bacterium]